LIDEVDNVVMCTVEATCITERERIFATR